MGSGRIKGRKRKAGGYHQTDLSRPFKNTYDRQPTKSESKYISKVLWEKEYKFLKKPLRRFYERRMG